MKWRKTKIIASLGPATDSDQVLAAMIDAGLDGARINCSHQDREEMIKRGRALREAALLKNRPVSLLVDLQGPKIRLSRDIILTHLKTDEIVLLGDRNSAGPGVINVEVDDLSSIVSVGSEIIIGDGYPRLVVEKVAREVFARVLKPGPVSPGKGFVVTYQKSGKGLTEKDFADLKTATEIGADFVALSFVRDKKDIDEVRRFLKKEGSRARVIAKIEKLEAVANIETIIDSSDGVLVARGDYGIEAGLSEVPVMQKMVLGSAGRAGKLSITATQMLESMIESPLPTRAEASDVANAVFDQTSAVMLSAETAVGKYPVEAIRTMVEIIDSAENYLNLSSLSAKALNEETTHDPIMSSATTLAKEAGADAIVVVTDSGKSARAAARHRPEQPIFALTPFQRVCDQLALEWGIFPLKFKNEERTSLIIKKSLPIIKSVLGKDDATIILIRGDQSGPHTIRLIQGQ